MPSVLEIIDARIANLKGKAPVLKTVDDPKAQLLMDELEKMMKEYGFDADGLATAGTQLTKEAGKDTPKTVPEIMAKDAGKDGSVLPLWAQDETLAQRVAEASKTLEEAAAKKGGMAGKLMGGIVVGILGFAGLAILLTHFLQKK